MAQKILSRMISTLQMESRSLCRLIFRTNNEHLPSQFSGDLYKIIQLGLLRVPPSKANLCTLQARFGRWAESSLKENWLQNSSFGLEWSSGRHFRTAFGAWWSMESIRKFKLRPHRKYKIESRAGTSTNIYQRKKLMNRLVEPVVRN